MLDSPRNLFLALALSALAGFVDGIGFLHLGGLFVSFMSGNSTRMGVSLAEAHWGDAAYAAGLIGLFVAGAALGSLIMRLRSAYSQVLLLMLEGGLLTAATLCHLMGLPQSAVAGIVLAMGLENAAFQIRGGGGLGLTYVTGALVKVGQQLAAALTGGPWFGWVPNVLLWAALVTGSAVGAWTYLRINLMAIGVAAGFAFLLAVFVAATVARKH
ncbi:conserved membrane hypothetical protein [Bradyrhizobium sp. STM 3843]|uniref:YoaK family protein n=1 Tax=Bradyrhizobium sp. STM 3843 TaxID=551947 RepID=UPI000240AFC5|nr:YoaK family protein [Bradyrhizobium sp. STM 3843]CCE06412.1 conserved membrane hypothetical protein [Bradyrhizobium sp. STM 3843]